MLTVNLAPRPRVPELPLLPAGAAAPPYERPFQGLAGRASPSTRAPCSGLSRLQSPVVCRKGAISGHWSLHRGTGLSEDLQRFPVCSGVRKSACCHSRRLAAVMTYLAGLCFCTIISVKCGRKDGGACRTPLRSAKYWPSYCKDALRFLSLILSGECCSLPLPHHCFSPFAPPPGTYCCLSPCFGIGWGQGCGV